MKPTRNIFDWASLLSLLSVVILIILGVVLLILESTGFSDFAAPTPLVVLLVFIFTVGVIMLWVEAWIWISRGWKRRSLELNLGLILFMLIGPVFAAYGIHFFSKSRGKS